MMSSLFEIYDPYVFLVGFNLSWLSCLFIFFGAASQFWTGWSSVSGLFYIILFKLSDEFSSLYVSAKLKKTSLLLFVTLFVYLFLTNLLGLIPYTFSSSSHFVFSFSLGLPLWLSFMLLGWAENTNFMFAHLIPAGTPIFLIPLMVLIETISSLIRPWSLSVRLMANMISGHLLMSLLGSSGGGFILIQIGLFLFEFFVCFIQAYVFSVLLTLYSGEL